MIFQFKYNKYPITADEAGLELERIEKKYNGYTPKNIVDEARETESVLHPVFEWDDGVAGELYRESQAQELTRNIVRVKLHEESDTEIIPVRAFVSVTDRETNSKKYVTITNAVADEDYEEQVLAQAFKELASFKAKYANLKVFSDLFKFIEKLIA